MTAQQTTQYPRTVARWLKIAKGLLEQPTAACFEQLPQAHVRAFVAARPALSLSSDAAGNLLVKYPASGARRRPPLVMVAHLDHPGFWIMHGGAATTRLLFRGYVRAGHTRLGDRVRFFEPGKREATGRGELVRFTEARGRLAWATARVLDGVARTGGFAMWDFPGFALEDGAIVSRAIDDPLGAAAALCVLDEIARRKPGGIAVWALLTRAEEIGFLGTLEALRLKTLPKNARVLSLETSKAAGIAPQGDGVVVRVGDNASIFDPALTEALRQAAQEVRRRKRGFRFQRKLMDGGACEATPFCAFGYRASGLAVPLGNYHNQALLPARAKGKHGKDCPGRPTIGPENVRVDDFVSEIELLVGLALRPRLLDCTGRELPPWFKERAAAARRLLSSRPAALVVKYKREV